MSSYHNDFTCSMYDFYMLTGEGAEYFEDAVEDEAACQDECEQEEELYFETLDEQLDYIIQCLEQEIEEKKHMMANQNAESK